jgi:hypothetical protein
MPSTVTDFSSLIDTTFPVPGQDNDTQGFRDNFGNIKNALAAAASELSDLDIIFSALVSVKSDAPISEVGAPGDLKGQIYVNSTTIAIAYDNFVDTSTNIWNIIDTTQIDRSVKYADFEPLSRFGSPGDTKGTVYATTNTFYYCFQNYISTATACWGKVALDSTSW